LKTDDLIESLVADEAAAPVRPGAALALSVLAGALIAAVLFFVAIRPRPDIADAAHHIRFLFKFVATASLAVTALCLILPLAQPGATVHRAVLAVAPVLLGLACLAELLAVPSAEWGTRLVGTNARFCLTLIPLLSLGPLACFLWLMRWCAPTAPGFAGLAAGLAASGIGATFYAAHCTDDSPLFVAVWYSLATTLVATAGFYLGRRYLRW